MFGVIFLNYQASKEAGRTTNNEKKNRFIKTNPEIAQVMIELVTGMLRQL